MAFFTRRDAMEFVVKFFFVFYFFRLLGFKHALTRDPGRDVWHQLTECLVSFVYT